MKPSQSYRIWFTPRTGSSWLCDLLTATGLAGQPEELFNIDADVSLLETYQVSDYLTLKQKLWAKSTSPNGVFGIKHSYIHGRYYNILAQIAEGQGLNWSEHASHEPIWADFFPNVRHIYLTRRNKIRQAVSWWKAIQTAQWHIRKGETHQALPADFYETRYEPAALRHLYIEAGLRECGIEAYFAQEGIIPLTIVYEDLVRDTEATIQRILKFLSLPPDADFSAGLANFKRTANPHSEAWVERFRKDLQEGWDKVTW